MVHLVFVQESASRTTCVTVVAFMLIPQACFSRLALHARDRARA